MKVAIGIDGSHLANHAVQFMGRLLSPKVDDILLYYSPPELHASSRAPVPEQILRDANKALADSVFQSAKYYLSPELLTVTESIQGTGLPSNGLLELAESNRADLIVVGSQSAKRRFPYILGSTARAVIHHTDRPVMVVRGEAKPNSEPLKVLITCDQERWQDTSSVLREFSWPENTISTLFHVTEALEDDYVQSLLNEGTAYAPDTSGLVQDYQAAIERRVYNYAESLEASKTSGPSVLRDADVEVERGDAVNRILEKVDRDQIDLVVLASRQLGVVGRMLGSVTESLLSHCPCSLLIVHAEERKTSESDRNRTVGASL